jgi:hypothetical protein
MFLSCRNYIDWLSYLSLLAAFVTHLADVSDHSTTLARWHARVMSVALILSWFRLLKYVRAFPFLGNHATFCTSCVLTARVIIT